MRPTIKTDIAVNFAVSLFISLLCTIVIDKLFTIDLTVSVLLFIILMLLLILLILINNMVILSSKYITYLGSKEESYGKAKDIVLRANEMVISLIKGPTFPASTARDDFFSFIEDQISKNQNIRYIRIFYEDFSKISSVEKSNFILEHICNISEYSNVEIYLLDSTKNIPLLSVDKKYFLTPMFEIDSKTAAGLYFVDEELGREFFRHIDKYIRGNPRVRRLYKENIKDYYKCLI